MNLRIKNFKKFEKLELPLEEEPILITGKSGAGKTQILWAYLLFFRAFNLRTKDNLDLRNEVCLLLNPAFSGFQHWDTFVRTISKSQHYGIAKFKGTLSNTLICFKIRANGFLTLETSVHNSPTKIAYAHMGTNYQFGAERSTNSTISSFDQSLRHKYTQLSDEHKMFINAILQYLFEGFISVSDVVRSKFEYPSAIICEEICEEDTDKKSTIKLEVMVKSAAFQKVFAALILYYTLIEVKFDGNNPSDRYYLIDEPDALLDQELALNFFKILIELAAQKNVKLIAVTSNPGVYLSIKKGLKKYTLSKTIVAVEQDS